MAGDESTVTASKFGGCCTELKEAMVGEDFDPLITEGDDGVLYMAVGLIDLEEDEPGLVDHPPFFCPFCGTKRRPRRPAKVGMMPARRAEVSERPRRKTSIHGRHIQVRAGIAGARALVG
jgi:hypothetical protein